MKRRKGWLKAKRQQTVTDDQMLRLVNGILASSNSKPIVANTFGLICCRNCLRRRPNCFPNFLMIVFLSE